MTLAALEATLRLYLEEPRALAGTPVLRMLTRPVAELDGQARSAWWVRCCFGDRLQVEVVSEGRAGGGASPQAPLPSRALTLALLWPPRNWKPVCAKPVRRSSAGWNVGWWCWTCAPCCRGIQEGLMAALEEGDRGHQIT